MSEVSRLGAAQLTWEPEARRATLRFVDEAASAGRAEAEQLTSDLDAWLAGSRDPFQMLVDCSEMATIDAGWRQRWADFFTEHRDRATLAWFNANPEVALIVTMFRKGTGVVGEVFADEADARAYLESHRA
jgi:hypothetical protein